MNNHPMIYIYIYNSSKFKMLSKIVDKLIKIHVYIGTMSTFSFTLRDNVSLWFLYFCRFGGEMVGEKWFVIILSR